MEPGPRPAGSGCGSPAGLSREYKLVMLGAGGVGKSGRCPCFRFPHRTRWEADTCSFVDFNFRFSF